jgi:hypothetical protein
MSLAYIRNFYDVPAKRGGRVEYYGATPTRFGTIIGASGAYIRIRLDGDKYSHPYHPTWCLKYLDQEGRGDE